MLHWKLRGLLQSYSCNQLPLIRLCTTFVHPETLRVAAVNSIHNVSLTGKVSNIFKNQINGTVTFYLRSNSEGNFNKVHKAFMTGKKDGLIKFVDENLAVNQSVYIEGKLNTSRFQTDNGKNRTSTAIRVTEFCLLNDSAATAKTFDNVTVDENSVELLGQLSTEVIDGNDFKSFTLSVIKNPYRDVETPAELSYNQIFVYDETLFPVLENYTVRKDQFFVRGEISYRINKNEFGKNQSSSYIIAKQLYRRA